MSDGYSSNSSEARILRLEARVGLLTALIEAVGWLTVAAALAVVLVITPRGGGRILPHLFNVAHVVLSAGLAVVACRLSRKICGYLTSLPSWVHIMVGLFAVLVFGGGLEIVQRYAPGEPSWRDLAIDMLGGVCGLLCLPVANLVTGRWAWVIRFIGVLAGLAAVWPSARAIYRHKEHDYQFPSLVRFSDAKSPYIELNGGAELKIVERPEGFSSGRSAVAELVLPGGEGYPGIEVGLSNGDWGPHEELVLEFYLPADEALQVQFRVHDWGHQAQFDDRFNAEFVLRPGINVVRFRVKDIEQAPKGRKMDLKHVAKAILFMKDPPNTTRLLMGELRLE